MPSRLDACGNCGSPLAAPRTACRICGHAWERNEPDEGGVVISLVDLWRQAGVRPGGRARLLTVLSFGTVCALIVGYVLITVGLIPLLQWWMQ